MAQATPGGIVTREAFERLTRELLERLSRAAYEPIAGAIIEIDTAGVTSVNPDRFRYHNALALWGAAGECQY